MPRAGNAQEIVGDGMALVAQALHGYRNGHELLASSQRLSRDADRALLELSDLSGSAARIGGFETYLSGYPVPGQSLYAFARTWIVKEGGRPGSVWTHTFLLTREQLELQSVVNLAKWFRRPESPSQISEYEIPFSIGEHELAAAPSFEQLAAPWPSGRGLAMDLFEGLYGDASARLPVLIPAISAQEHEDLLLESWSIQWPALREHFSFCSGSLSLRRIGGQPFDLQVVPADRVGAIERSASSGAYVIGGSHLEAQARASSAQLDPDQADLQALAEFTWRFGPALPEERSSFGRLADIFPITRDLAGRADWELLLEKLGDWYPEPLAAGTLKSWALQEPNQSLDGSISSLDRLVVLSQLRGASAFLEWEHAIARAFIEALADDEHELIPLVAQLAATTRTSTSEALLRLSSENLGPRSFVDFLQFTSEPAARDAIRLRPSILREASIWQLEATRRAALAWLATSKVGDELIADILGAIVIAGQSVALREVVDRAGERVIDVAFEVLAERSSVDPDLELDQEWQITLSENSERGVSWLANSSKPSTTLVTSVLAQLLPRDQRIRRFGVRRWIEIVDRAEPSTKEGLSVYAFALGVGLLDQRASASSLVARVFDPVHDAASFGRLAPDDWEKLQASVPVSRRSLLVRGSGLDQDRVLRRVLVEVFGRRRAWPVSDLLSAVGDARVLARLVTENRRTKSGRELKERVRNAIRVGLVLTERERYALRPWID